MYPIFLLICAIFSYFFLDRFVAENLFSLPTFSLICKCLSKATSPFYLLIGSIFFFALTLVRKQWKLLRINAFFTCAAISLTMFFTGNLKMLTRRPRPSFYLREGSYGFFMGNIDSSFLSFPSSHAAVAIAIATLLAHWFPRYKKWLYLGTIPLLIIRIILQKHFISDILIGSLVGYFVAKLTIKYGIENEKAPKILGSFLKIKLK